MTPDIEVKGVTKLYGSSAAVNDVSFAVAPGHLLSLLGPSGCGKTTTMRMIAGLVEPTRGTIAIKGRPVSGVPVHRRNIGMLFQSYALFPHLDVTRNVAFGLQMRRLPKDEVARRVTGALDMVKLTHLADRMPHQLSGGQQQRVALARALVIEPAVLLLDEPLGALDKKLRDSMQIELSQLQRRLGLTTLMVTHDQDEALTLSDQIAVMRDGRIEQIGAPGEIYDRPASRFVASFIGTSNFFQGRAGPAQGGEYAVEAEGVRLTLPGPPPPGPVLVALRPESIRLHPGAAVTGPNQCPTTVEQVIYRGQHTQYLLRRPDGEIMTAIRHDDGLRGGLEVGAAVLASWDGARNRVIRDDA